MAQPALATFPPSLPFLASIPPTPLHLWPTECPSWPPSARAASRCDIITPIGGCDCAWPAHGSQVLSATPPACPRGRTGTRGTRVG